MSANKKQFLIPLLIAGALALPAAANAQGYGYQNPYGPNPYARPAQPQMQDPAEIVSDRLAKVRRFLSQAAGKISQNQAMNFIERNISPDVDFDMMTEMALGPMARRMSDELKADAKSLLKSNFTERLVNVIGDVRKTRLTVGRAQRGSRPDEAEVPVLLAQWQGRPMELTFRFYAKDGKWKMFDAEANGQSAVLFYRTLFRKQLRERMWKERAQRYERPDRVRPGFRGPAARNPLPMTNRNRNAPRWRPHY